MAVKRHIRTKEEKDQLFKTMVEYKTANPKTPDKAAAIALSINYSIWRDIIKEYGPPLPKELRTITKQRLQPEVVSVIVKAFNDHPAASWGELAAMTGHDSTTVRHVMDKRSGQTVTKEEWASRETSREGSQYDRYASQVKDLYLERNLTQQETAATLGIAEGQVKQVIDRHNLHKTSYQRAQSSARNYGTEIWTAIDQERAKGATEAELSVKYDIPTATLGAHWHRNGQMLSPEVAQQNAHAGRLAVNSNAMEDMRNARTPESFVKQAATAKVTWTSPILRKAASEATTAQQRALKEDPGYTTVYSWEDVAAKAKSFGLTPIDFGTGAIKTGRYVRLGCSQPNCQNEFETNLYDVMRDLVKSCGCVKSHDQKAISNHFKAKGLVVQDDTYAVISTPSKQLQLDMYFPNEKVAIEYCGLHWHGEAFAINSGRTNGRTKHREKYLECQKQGIRLVTVFSDEYLGKKEIVLGYLESILGISKARKVHGRATEIKELSSEVAQKFWENNHLQGRTKTPVAYGLFENDDLVSAMGFYQRENGVWELARYAPKMGVQVQGGFQKLLAHFRLGHTGKIVTFADLRWSVGGVYKTAGFIEEGQIVSSYSYFKKNSQKERLHKGNFRKAKIGCQPGQTEFQRAQELGYDRIWDCGKIRFALP